MQQQLQILCPEDVNTIPHAVGTQYRMIVPGGFVPGHLQMIYVYLLSKKIGKVSIYRHQGCRYPVVGRLAALTVGLFRALPKLPVEVIWTRPAATPVNPIEVVVIQCVDCRYQDLGRLSSTLHDPLEEGRALLVRVPGARAPRTLLTTLHRIAPSPKKVIVLAHPDCAYEKYFFIPSWARWWWRGKRPAEWTFAAAKKTWSNAEVVLVEDDHPAGVPH
ncbi:MAG: hypothetical protein U1F76_03460 [Candidatus Competibacteraceae bacterium]